MPRDPRKLLEDARYAAANIVQFTSGRTLNEYTQDVMLHSAVERQFEIIGEAFSKLTREFPDVAARVCQVQRIIDFRNVLAHGYDIVDDALVWDIVQNRLPALLTELVELIQNVGPQSK